MRLVKALDHPHRRVHTQDQSDPAALDYGYAVGTDGRSNEPWREPAEREEFLARLLKDAPFQLDDVALVTQSMRRPAKLGERRRGIGLLPVRTIECRSGAEMELHRSSRRQPTKPAKTTPKAAATPCEVAMKPIEIGGSPNASPIA